MGKAKRRQALRTAAASSELQQCDFAAVAKAVRDFAVACSDVQGADCYSYAIFGQSLLGRLGLPADIAVGYAAWRVGSADHDVVAHHPQVQSFVAPFGSAARMYHAWIEVAGRILDLTTHLLRRKAALLDAADGYRTTVDWCPDFLPADRRQVASFGNVQQGHAGLFHYERRLELEAQAQAEALPPDEEELAALWLIYQNPGAIVLGPNNISQRGGRRP
jgi:hypothetical protein